VTKFTTSTPSSAEIIPFARELQQLNGAVHAHPGAGHNGPPPNDLDRPDPLAGMTKKQIFINCIWLSDESPTTKLVLLCISRFFNANALASSMAYSQIEADCSLSDRAVKGAVADAERDDTASATKKAVRKGAQDARERWLLIERQKGFRTASGPQNLYHGIAPERWVTKLRELRSRGVSVEVDEGIVRAADAATAGLQGVQHVHPLPNGVQQDHPSTPEGVQHVHPLDPRGESGASKGCSTFTLTYNTKKERKSGADAPSPANAGLAFDGNSTPKESPASSPRARVPRAGPAPPTRAEIDARFADFWKAYPRKEGKELAREAFTKLCEGKHRSKRRATPEQLIEAARLYAIEKQGVDRQYVKTPSAWLNELRWMDDKYQREPDPDAAQAQIDLEDAIRDLRKQQGEASE
jgi:hypothetical protein